MSPDKSLIVIKNLKKFQLEGGDVLHALKESENEFFGFGEAYFSTIRFNKIKAWKRHLKMTMNLIVPIGEVQFNFYDFERNILENIIIGQKNYCRITVPPMVWFGFKGLNQQDSLVLNIASIPHDSKEVDRLPISAIPFDW